MISEKLSTLSQISRGSGESNLNGLLLNLITNFNHFIVFIICERKKYKDVIVNV